LLTTWRFTKKGWTANCTGAKLSTGEETILPFLNQHTLWKETIRIQHHYPAVQLHVSNHSRLSFDYNMETNQRELKKKRKFSVVDELSTSVSGYGCTKDGTQIPYLSSTNRGWKKNGKNTSTAHWLSRHELPSIVLIHPTFVCLTMG